MAVAGSVTGMGPALFKSSTSCPSITPARLTASQSPSSVNLILLLDRTIANGVTDIVHHVVGEIPLGHVEFDNTSIKNVSKSIF